MVKLLLAFCAVTALIVLGICLSAYMFSVELVISGVGICYFQGGTFAFSRFNHPLMISQITWEPGVRVWPLIDHSTALGGIWSIQAWPICLFAGITLCAATRGLMRSRSNAEDNGLSCPHCGYDCGAQIPTCPECGRPTGFE